MRSRHSSRQKKTSPAGLRREFEQPVRSLDRHRARPLHAGRRRPRGFCISRSCARRTRTRESARSTRPRRWPFPGVVGVYTWEDVPRKLYSTALHEDHLVDPDDTYMLDDVARFVGQRLSRRLPPKRKAPPKKACRLRRDRLRDPARRLRSRTGDGARRAAAARPSAVMSGELGSERNIFVDIHGEVGSVAAGLRRSRRRP